VQFARHRPPMHDSPAAQAFPHMPQFLGSELRLKQTPLQLVVPPGQVHAPFRHCWPVEQVRPQAPQFVGSLDVVTQEPPQLLVPAAQLATH
jgi:hypothetical protein